MGVAASYSMLMPWPLRAGVGFILALLLLRPSLGIAQDLPYLKNKTSHTFAQLYLGLDVLSHLGDVTTTEASGKMRSLSAPIQGRLVIGGLHFWGHADIYVAFPIRRQAGNAQDVQVDYTSGIETGFRVHPLRISSGLVPSPFLGLAWHVRRYQQTTARSKGPDYLQHRFSQQIGFTWAGEAGLWELGYMRFRRSKQRIVYPTSRTHFADVRLPNASLWLGWRWLKDTTNAKKGQPSASLGSSDGAFTLGVGPSSSFSLKNSPYLEKNRPHLGQKNASIFPEYSLGAYLGSLDAAIWVSARDIKTEREAYATNFTARRKVNSLEMVKFFANYHGFVPFIGPAFGAETLSIRETDNGKQTAAAQRRTNSLGLVYGWDIRPRDNAFLILRTILRYTPELYVTYPNTKDRIYFDSLEFNFIQLVLHFR